MATDDPSPTTQSSSRPIAQNGEGNPHSVATVLNYWKDPGDGSPPTPLVVGGPKGQSLKNERPFIPTNVVVTDVSDDVGHYTLDSHGFQYNQHTSEEKEFADEAKITSEYYRECEQLLREVTGASRIFIFDHKVRRGPTHWHHLGVNNLANRGPVTRVHVDQSYDGAEMLLRWHLPDEADALTKKRWEIINIWRPIKTIYKDPIAVADANSIPESDLVGAAVHHPSHSWETWTLRPNPAHRWHYKQNLRPDEVLFIKCFDSEKDGRARRVPHSAFEDPKFRDGESRQSVEVRCMVFHDE